MPIQNPSVDIIDGGGGGSSSSTDPGQYYVHFHNVPSGFSGSDNITGVHASQYTLPSLPPTETLREKVTYQQFNSSGAAATSTWDDGYFTVSKVYSHWYVESSIDGTWVGMMPGNTISFSSYTNTTYDNIVNVYASYTYNVEGTFSKGCYDYKNIQIRGKLGYDVDDTVVTLNNQLCRFFSAKSWTSINGLPINDGGIEPGTTQKLTGFPTGYYTEGEGFYVTGQLSSIGSWKTHSNSKKLSNIGTPSSRPSTTSSYVVYLETSAGVDYPTQQLQVSGTISYTFKHWSLTSEGAAADLNVIPTSNTTLYAVWDASSDQGTKLPSWSTPEGALLLCKDEPYAVHTLRCYRLKTDTSPYLTKTAEEFEYKPPKHTGWKVGSEIFGVNDLVTKGGGTVYSAIWEPDVTKPSEYKIYDNVVEHSVPESRTGYKYVGLSGVNGDSTIVFNYPDAIEFNSNLDLYAIWECTGACRISTEANTFKIYHLWVYDGTKWKLHMPKIFDGTTWKDYA